MGGKGSGRKAIVEYIPVDGVEAWDRQPDETDKAFAAFAAYRDLGADRTVAKAIEALGKKPNYRSTCEAWSRQWSWVARVGAWDSYEDRRKREAVLKVAERKAVQKLNVADALWMTAAKGLGMWANYLDRFLEDHPGEQPPISPADVNRLADTGLKLSQLLEGKPTEIEEQRMQITVEERRKGLQRIIGNPQLRAAMKQANDAIQSEGKKEPDSGGNGHVSNLH